VDAKTFGYRLIQPIIKKNHCSFIYRLPNNDIKAFLDNKLETIKCNNQDIYLFGFNINIQIETRTPSAGKYLYMMASNGLFPLITKPTRVTDESKTVIDHIFTSSLSKSMYPGIIQSDFSDHYSI